MKFFIDTANLNEIKGAQSLGLIDGVTTNPSLVAKEGKEFKSLIKEICSVVDGPVCAEVLSLDAKGMVREGREVASLDPKVTVKIPITLEGLKAIRILSEEDIKVNTTLIFSPLQALLAAKAGATYVSPFIGRLDDVSEHGMELVEKIVTIFDNYAFETEIIVASVRNPLHILDAALLGADICTIPYQVLMQLVKHPLTDVGIEKFLNDWKKTFKP